MNFLDQARIDRLEREFAQLVSTVETMKGELTATSMWLHTLAFAHGDPQRLLKLGAEAVPQSKARLQGSTDWQGGFDSADEAVRKTLAAAGKQGPGVRAEGSGAG